MNNHQILLYIFRKDAYLQKVSFLCYVWSLLHKAMPLKISWFLFSLVGNRFTVQSKQSRNNTKTNQIFDCFQLSFIASDDRSRITVSPGMVRRANQLSAVIHENIFYSFCYEDICPDLLRYNLEISKVIITVLKIIMLL